MHVEWHANWICWRNEKLVVGCQWYKQIFKELDALAEGDFLNICLWHIPMPNIRQGKTHTLLSHQLWACALSDWLMNGWRTCEFLKVTAISGWPSPPEGEIMSFAGIATLAYSQYAVYCPDSPPPPPHPTPTWHMSIQKSSVLAFVLFTRPSTAAPRGGQQRPYRKWWRVIGQHGRLQCSLSAIIAQMIAKKWLSCWSTCLSSGPCSTRTGARQVRALTRRARVTRGSDSLPRRSCQCQPLGRRPRVTRPRHLSSC